MFGDARVLVREDEPFIAIEFATTVQNAGGYVIGPANRVTENAGIT